MKINKSAALALTCVFMLPGCGKAVQQDIPEDRQTFRQAVAMKSQPDEYTLYYTQKYPPSLYEPETGCYAGAYVLSNRDINFDITTFDNMTGKTHAVCVYNLKAGNPFPGDWVIGCIAAKKTPYFVITPPNEYNPYDKAMIDSYAEQFGAFYIPMFVEFYPVNGLDGDSKAYVDFFQYAREKFREKASNAAFVWAVNAKAAADSDAWYPGDAYTDWVGLHSIEPLINAGYGPDIFNAVDYIYYTYQKAKPMVISQFAVSHYTNTDYVYQNQIASDEITRVYNEIINNYPRIKMINYMDFDESMADPAKKSDYYTVTENDNVLSAYRNAVADSRYLSSVISGAEPQSGDQLMRSPFPVLKIGEDWYASEYSFIYDLNTKGTLGARNIGGRNYYNMSFFLKNADKSLTVDEAARKLVLADNNTSLGHKFQ